MKQLELKLKPMPDTPEQRFYRISTPEDTKNEYNNLIIRPLYRGRGIAIPGRWPCSAWKKSDQGPYRRHLPGVRVQIPYNNKEYIWKPLTRGPAPTLDSPAWTPPYIIWQYRIDTLRKKHRESI